MPLKDLLCGLLETGVNQLHQLDNNAVKKRQNLNGTIIKVCLKTVSTPLFFVISTQQIDILSHFEGVPDCVIRIEGSALGKLQDNRQLTNLIKTGQLEVEGDIQLVQQFAILLTDMHIDWEEHLSKKVGDVLAHSLCALAKKTQLSISRQHKQVQKQTALYLTEELKMAPSGLEVAYFCEQISSLQSQTDALSTKLDALLASVNKRSTNDKI